MCVGIELWCVFDFCYYSASSPVRLKVTVLATADYRLLPPFGRERLATLCVSGTELLLCVFGFCYYSASSPVKSRASVLATADYWRLPLIGQEQPATLCVFGTELLWSLSPC